MENFNDTQKEGLAINRMGIELLGKAAKWAKFLSVVMYVCVVCTIIMALFTLCMRTAMGGILGGMSAGAGAFVYIVMAVFNIFYAMYLSKFASKAKLAIATNSTDMLTESLKGLSSYFTLQGVLTLITIIFGFIAIIVSVVAGIAMAL